MNCQNCGKEIPESTFFCPYCGVSVNAAAEAQSNNPSPEQIPPNYNQAGYQTVPPQYSSAQYPYGQQPNIKQPNQANQSFAQTTPQQPVYQNYPPQYYPPQYNPVLFPQTASKSKPDGLAIASMVLGICSILFSSSIFFGLACSILALVFASKVTKNSPENEKNKGFLTAGKICGIIGLIFTVLWIIFWICFFVLIANIGSELSPYVTYEISSNF